MSLTDDDFLVKIQIKISKMTVFKRRKFLGKFEKLRATCTSIGSMGGMLAWMAWMTYLRGWSEFVDLLTEEQNVECLLLKKKKKKCAK